jgi:hypothetical protein
MPTSTPVEFIDEWLTANAPYVSGHVVDFALDLRTVIEALLGQGATAEARRHLVSARP